MFLFPQIVPRTLEQLNWKADIEASLKQQEDAHENEMKAIREHMKNKTVLGQEPATPEDTEADDDDLTEDESEEEASEGELEDDA